jgi:hypothetical protein
MKNTKDFTCPICFGAGVIEDPKHMNLDVQDVRREMALKLNAKGFSMRQIQRALGYKSVRSVSLLLKSTHV